MLRFVALIIGYCFGLFQTGYLYGRLNNIDIRDYGSGNAGTTNAMRTLGKKAGIITFLGDALKSIFAAVTIHILFGHNNREIEALLFCYSGLGVILGHNFPFYLNFRGGKGIAASGGVIATFFPYNMLMTFAAIFTFAVTAFATKYVSVASLSLMLAFFVEFVFFTYMGDFCMSTPHNIEACIIILVITVLAFVRHKDNLIRLYNNNERRIGEKRKN